MGLSLRAVLILAVGLGGVQPACRRSARSYDNLVLVTIDTQRADRLGLYGYPRPTSPFLDRFAKEGIVFWHAVAASSHTAPSHATLLTSLYPEQHQVMENGLALPEEVTSLAEIAGQAGMDTAAFVSVRFLAGLSQGFKTFDADVDSGEVFRTADLTVGRAIEWLRSRDRSRRFALWIHVYDPHQHRGDVEVPGPQYDRMRADATRRGKELLYFLQQEQGYPADKVHGSIDRYDAQVAFVDEQMERLFTALETVAPAARTLRVVTADHGEGLGNHNFQGHGRHIYQEQLRVPLIVQGDPGRHPPGMVRRLVRHVDVLPTLAELLALPFDRTRLRPEGHSLVPLLSNPTAPVPIDAAFSQRRPPSEKRREMGWEVEVKLAAQDGEYKYIWSSEGPHEFYDLRRDPYELNNLIDAPIPEKERLRQWVEAKHRALARDRRGKAPRALDERQLEELKALGYI